MCPHLKPVFVLTCHYAVSKLCKGMSHHNGVRHVSARLHIHRGFDHGHQCAAAGSMPPHQRLRQPDSAHRALLLACRVELRHARFRLRAPYRIPKAVYGKPQELETNYKGTRQSSVGFLLAVSLGIVCCVFYVLKKPDFAPKR